MDRVSNSLVFYTHNKIKWNYDTNSCTMHELGGHGDEFVAVDFDPEHRTLQRPSPAIECKGDEYIALAVVQPHPVQSQLAP